MDEIKKTGRRRHGKKWRKKRIRRYARAWAFRLLALLIVAAACCVLFFGGRALVRGASGLFGGNKEAKAEETVPVETQIPETAESGITEPGVTEPETAEPETTESETEASAPVITTLKLTAVGDCALGNDKKQSYAGSFNQTYDNEGEEYFFRNVRSLFEADDLTLVNLEGTLTTEKTYVKKPFNIKGDPSYTGIMTCSSIECAVLGNNHTMDYGKQGLQDTKDALDAADIPWALNDDAAIITTDAGVRVGIISRETLSISNKLRKKMVEQTKKLKESGEVDLIIACCHWGTEKKYTPSKRMTRLAHELIDAGADVIIGHHPHVLQGMEVYKGKMICYSLGNFCFGGNRKPFDYNTMIYQQTFTFVDGVLQTDLDAQVLPARVSSVKSPNNFQPTLAEGDKKQELLEKINGYCAKVGDVTVDADGKISYGSTKSEETEEAETETEASGSGTDSAAETAAAETSLPAASEADPASAGPV